MRAGASLDTLKVISQMAFRNLFASRLKTIIVGVIILFGALLVVLGTSLLDSVVASMSRSVTGSVAGHLQIYSAKAKDDFAVMGSMTMGDPDIGQIDDFVKVHDALSKLPNVKAVVPMGISGALVSPGNTIDTALEKLRTAIRKKQAGDTSATLASEINSQKEHVRQILTVLQGDMKNIKTIAANALGQDELDNVSRASSPAFWADFDKDPLDALEFLENKIAPLGSDADFLFLRYAGTDLDAFAKSFDRMRIVDGTNVPSGHRGFLFSKYVYEDQIKLKSARRLDLIKEGRDIKHNTIAKDEELQRLVRENASQVREIVFQLDALKTKDFRAKLQKFLGSQDADVGALLTTFFTTDDQNFDARFAFFYKELAPSLDLYRVRIGDVLTIKAFTRSGYVQSVNLPVYGTFEFTGLEKSGLAGGLNLMDLVSFRELYGFLTKEKQAEIQAMRAAMGAKDVSRENAEAELFGSRTIEADATPGLAVPLRPADAPAGGESLANRLRREDLSKRVFDPNELQSGVVLNAAVLLKDASHIDQDIVKVKAAAKEAGLDLNVISWQQASGLVGQLVMLLKLVLFTAVLIIFIVALVIINNAMVMATLERVKEIGTLRAVGAQRRFITAMLIIESLVVGLVFGTIRAALGAGIILFLHAVGIPAGSDIMQFFFSGPRLFPFMSTGNLVAALLIVAVVSALSSFYPAWLAMRVTPRQAMQSEE